MKDVTKIGLRIRLGYVIDDLQNYLDQVTSLRQRTLLGEDIFGILLQKLSHEATPLPIHRELDLQLLILVKEKTVEQVIKFYRAVDDLNKRKAELLAPRNEIYSTTSRIATAIKRWEEIEVMRPTEFELFEAEIKRLIGEGKSLIQGLTPWWRRWRH